MLKDIIKEINIKIEHQFIEKDFGLQLIEYLNKFYKIYDYLDTEILNRIRAFKEQNDIERLQNQWETQMLNKVQKQLVELMK